MEQNSSIKEAVKDDQTVNFFEVALDRCASVFSRHELAAAQSEVLDFMRPKPCPVELIRIGGIRDGAYLIPRDLAGVAACFSPGVKNRKSFEDELATNHGIPSFMCDKSSDVAQFATPLIEGRQSFRKVWLDTANSEHAVTLETWVAEEMSAPGDLLLQMDIEGAEYRILLAAQADLLRRFRVMALEFHGLQNE